MSKPSSARITSFLIKIASRCNLACDYCYVYEHADQSWKSQPAFMADETIHALAHRIGEYADQVGLERLLIVFHGGEPLLAGAERIVDATTTIRAAAPRGMDVEATIQTNGVLLSERTLDAFAEHRIGVSVSIDGPQTVNDLHRVDHQGCSTFDRTLAGIKLLEKYPSIYSGLISVIDARNSPNELFSFFRQLNPPTIDFLLPDANYISPPVGREERPHLYSRWLLQAFDVWFDNYADLHVRTFDALLESIAGLPSRTDAFGLGDVSLLTIETDGTYHDLDVLKIAYEGATALGASVVSHSIADALSTPQITRHRRLLTLEGLSRQCQECSLVRICGGGSVPHRYAADGYGHPTIYCAEMTDLILHAKRRVRQTLADSLTIRFAHDTLAPDTLADFEDIERSRPFVLELFNIAAARARDEFTTAVEGVVADGSSDAADAARLILHAPAEVQQQLAVQPSTVFWTSLTTKNMQGLRLTSVDSTPLDRQDSYLTDLVAWSSSGIPQAPRIHRNDLLLRLPFGKKISFEPFDGSQPLRQLIQDALHLVGQWKPSLVEEICQLSPEIQLITDPSADPDKAVSFSDNAVPGCLYISVRRGNGLLNPYEIADSIIHEHRHQRLYLFQDQHPIIAIDAPFVTSPWRADPRPPSGLFHAVYVFTELLHWWQHVSEEAEPVIAEYAAEEVVRVREKLRQAFPTLRQTALTATGRHLLDVLEGKLQGF